MKKKIILRLSNEIGNQMFMYASAYAISRKMNRELLLDNETAFLSKKNISKFGLDNFKITAPISEDNFKFKTLLGYLKRKFFIKSDFFILCSVFLPFPSWKRFCLIQIPIEFDSLISLKSELLLNFNSSLNLNSFLISFS